MQRAPAYVAMGRWSASFGHIRRADSRTSVSPSIVVDVAFGWTAFGHLGDGRLEVVRLPEAQRVYRGTGVGMLEFTKQPERARQFMDFLVTPEARACYEKYHWVLPATLQG